MNKHLNDGQLRAALDGELDEAGLQHLESCSPVQEAAGCDPVANAAGRPRAVFPDRAGPKKRSGR